MKRTSTYPVLSEPPYAHAITNWDPEKRILSWEYNGRPTISVSIPGQDPIDYRLTSDGAIASDPLVQQHYVKVVQPVTGTVTFTMSGDAINMRPCRAADEQAILGQVGRPLMFGVNGLYDILQDLLIDWHGADWKWLDERLEANADGNLVARITVELGPSPWVVNLRPQYYRKHLGYTHHKPWEWRPKVEPISGWCSWEAYRRDVTEEKIREVSRFVRDTFKPYGMKYIQVDDGFQPPVIPSSVEKMPADDWLDTNETFPGGHEETVRTIREFGLEPGIWFCSFAYNEEYARAHPVYLRDTDGEPIEGDWVGFVIDCLPDTIERYVKPIFEGLKKFGYSYVKTDGLRHLIYDGLHEAVRRGIITNDDADSRFRRYVECIRATLGNQVFYLSSWGVLTQMVGIADACRIATDADPAWSNMRMQMVESARWFHTQRVLFMNDPDHVCVRAKFEWSRSVLSLTSLSGGLFMLSDAVDEYDDKRISLIRKNLPPLNTYPGETGPLDMTMAAFPWTKAHGGAFTASRDSRVVDGIPVETLVTAAGKYPSLYDDNPFSTLWAFHMDVHSRRWCVLGRFATTPLRRSDISMELLGLDPETEYAVFDYWAEKYLGRVSGKVSCRELQLGDCQILALRPVTPQPQFLASSRHISMDAVSVESQAWENNTLRLILSVVQGTTEAYWIHVPAGFVPTGCTIDGVETGFTYEGEAVRVDAQFSGASADLTMHFKAM